MVEAGRMKSSKHLTVVIKLGTSSIVHETTHKPLLSILGLIVETAVRLREDGHRVVIVSSGAIGVALQTMNLEKRPKHLPAVQALAALGQCRLMSLWDNLFQHQRQPVAQILLTRNDIADRTQYQNAQNTFNELLNMGVIPIVNENDTLSVQEIKFGDNDTLSAITAGMVQADYLFLMTDVDCLYTTNPRKDPNAAPIEVITDISTLEADVSSAGSSVGTGGMATKITAAKLATSAGVTTIVTRSSKPGNVFDIVDYLERLRESEHDPSPPSLPVPPLHTRFLASQSPIRDRSFWLLHGLTPHGTLYIDVGAHRALSSKAGLLPVGIVDVEGNFGQQEAVRLVVVKRKGAPKLFSHSATPAHLVPSLTSRPPSGVWISGGAVTGPGPGQAGLAGYEAGLEADDPMARSTTSLVSLDLVGGGGSGELYEREDPAPREVGRALVNYSALEIARIKGMRSAEIAYVLGYADSEYVALRENISLVDKEKEGESKGTDEAGKEAVGAKERLGDLGTFGRGDTDGDSHESQQ